MNVPAFIVAVHKGSRTQLQRRCYWNSLRADVQIFRVTTSLSRGQLRRTGHGKLSIHFSADQETIETIFRIIQSERYVKSMNPFTRERCDPL